MLDNVGYYGEQGRKYNDEDIIFQDGFIWLILPNQTIELCLLADYNKPMSLKQIAQEHPRIRKVIYEDALRGVIFNYMNHPEIGWETIGELIGYA